MSDRKVLFSVNAPLGGEVRLEGATGFADTGIDWSFITGGVILELQKTDDPAVVKVNFLTDAESKADATAG